MEEVTKKHVIQQLRNADAWVDGLTKDIKGKSLPARYAIVKTRQYVDDYMAGKNTKRWVVMPGLRGVGKTTLLAQQYKYVKDKYGDTVNVLHLSLHDVANVVRSNLQTAIEQYESILGSTVEALAKPTFIFLDEVQEDENWGETLFSLHERSRKLFIFCSGSSAIYLKKDADMVRRAHFEPLYPLNYTEYQMLRFTILPETGLKAQLKDAVFGCKSAPEAHAKIVNLLPTIKQYLDKIDTSTFMHFMRIGSLPFLINETNSAQVYTSIISLIDRIENEDLAKGFSFDQATLNAVKPTLFMLAEGDVLSRTKLASTLKLDERVIGNLLNALVKTELLIEVPARGTATIAASKARKYLFMSPAIRATFHQIAGLNATEETRKGGLLEDLVGLYMHREFVAKRVGDFTYNAGKGQADFMLQTAAGARIPIEIGLGKKNSRQVVTTMKKVNSKYGVVISATPLSVDQANNILFLPLSIFYLM